MKQLIPRRAFGLLGMTVWIVSLAWAGAEDDFKKANAAYTAGDFRGTVQLYESVTARGNADGAVYYNLGNAYFRLGEKGKALLNYQRARRLLPRDKDVTWNIHILKSILADRIPDEKKPLPLAWNEIGLLFTAVLAGLLGVGVMATLFPRWGALWRLKTRFLVACLLTFFLLGAVQWIKTRDPRAVVLAKEIFTRYGPSEAETKAFLLHEGAEVSVLDESGDWFYITLPNKSSGWIPRSSVEVI
ncbi:MAG: tetratricopeptide repeat protein [Candidatus Omnitrophica bacterium]|nr:tetratricopeptide repeat protein [Candidatus Omnitrophota bacterium]